MRNLTEEEILLVSGGASEVHPVLSEVPASVSGTQEILN